MKILVLDNYDSFVFNLVHIIRELGYGEGLEVHRNNKIDLNKVEGFDKILLSPGPGVPSEAGIMPDLIKKYAPTKDIFGVCLGHQGIGETFGAKLINLPEVFHGLAKDTEVVQDDRLFTGVPKKFLSGRYHSWAVDPKSNLENLVITAIDENKNIMALRHKNFNVRGVQFHPESVLTEHGVKMIENWLKG